jgi:hypothetical protein
MKTFCGQQTGLSAYAVAFSSVKISGRNDFGKKK